MVLQNSLPTRAARQLGRNIAFVAAVMFLSAGSLRFWQAWILLTLMSACWTIVLINLLGHDSGIVERRLNPKETDNSHAAVVSSDVPPDGGAGTRCLGPRLSLRVDTIVATDSVLLGHRGTDRYGSLDTGWFSGSCERIPSLLARFRSKRSRASSQVVHMRWCVIPCTWGCPLQRYRCQSASGLLLHCQFSR